jgi:putative DNA methylase
MTIHPIKTPKKLIEVALPLDDINIASAREKTIRHGHPSSLHLWWARRPLAAARAVIFAQMVNDPGYERSLGRGVNKDRAKVERERLFNILRQLVQWENTNNEALLNEAREEILRSWRETCDLNRGHPDAINLFNPARLPAFHDPFAGGGAIPLEAQRLGLESYASDLNPVALVINKAMIEIPPKFAGQGPFGPISKSRSQVRIAEVQRGAMGLAEDMRRYGLWVKEEAVKRIGHLYPDINVPKEIGGGSATVIAWLWARTVRSPNPAFSHVDVPLVSSFVLCGKAGKEVYAKPLIRGDSYDFEIIKGVPPESAKNGTKSGGRGANFVCLLSQTPISGDYIKEQGQEGKMGARLMAVVAEGSRGRIYLAPTLDIEKVAKSAVPDWSPDVPFFQQALGFRVGNYGLSKWSDIFTARQLVALSTFSTLLNELKDVIRRDAIAGGLPDDGVGLDSNGRGATAYAEAIVVYLSFALDKMADLGNSLVRWEPIAQCPRQLFGRQAIPMIWDFAEANPLSSSSGAWDVFVDGLSKAFLKAFGEVHYSSDGFVFQADAQTQTISANKVVSTDPPYYDNIGYADLSDFFYVWMRRSLRSVFPDLFSTMSVPKAEELVATPARHGGRGAAEQFFLDGMTKAMQRIALQSHPAFPTTIYYAFKQSDTTSSGTVSTGWETFIEAVIRAGFSISGTWPLSTENESRLRGQVSNALASSIVLVCRNRPIDAPTVSRRDFIRELKEELSDAVEVMIGGAEGISPVAPVDLAQAVIGPGMAIYSKYSAVLEADGSPMTVHTALTLINRMLTEGTDDFDADTQFCLGWFDEQGWAEGDYGKADVLTRAKGTSVDHVKSAGVVEASGGKVRLLKPAEYPSDWAPENDNNTPVWEALHQMIRELRASGETASGALLAGMPQRADPIRNLAYRLYTLCERKGWAEDARAYNELITSWASIEASSHEKGHYGSQMSIEE